MKRKRERGWVSLAVFPGGEEGARVRDLVRRIRYVPGGLARGPVPDGHGRGGRVRLRETASVRGGRQRRQRRRGQVVRSVRLEDRQRRGRVRLSTRGARDDHDPV